MLSLSIADVARARPCRLPLRDDLVQRPSRRDDVLAGPGGDRRPVPGGPGRTGQFLLGALERQRPAPHLGARAPRPRAAGLPRRPGRRHDGRRAGREPGRAAARATWRSTTARARTPSRTASSPSCTTSASPARRWPCRAPPRPPARGTDRGRHQPARRRPSASFFRHPGRPRPRSTARGRAAGRRAGHRAGPGPARGPRRRRRRGTGVRWRARSSCGSGSTCAITSTSATSPRSASPPRTTSPCGTSTPPGRRRHQLARRRSRSNGSRHAASELRDPRHAHLAIATVGTALGVRRPVPLRAGLPPDLRGHALRVASLGRQRHR